MNKWRQYEQQILKMFHDKYPNLDILFDQLVDGRHSKTRRQVDILVKYRVADIDCIGVFDCKCYAQHVDVQTIDYMVGFLDDLGAKLGGVVTTKGFSDAAKNRAAAASIDLRTIEFESVQQMVEQFIPRLDFSDPSNSMYIPLVL